MTDPLGADDFEVGRTRRPPTVSAGSSQRLQRVAHRARIEGSPRRCVRIILPRPRGFCAGVEMALEGLERALDRFGVPLFAYHQIVHNKHIVASFEQRGVRFVDDLGDIPFGSTVVFSAHGVAPTIRAQAAARRLRVVDTTCPLVTKVHSEARRYAEAGYTVVFVGHRGHDEAVGVMGQAGDRGVLVETVEQADTLTPEDSRKVAVLTQTTLSIADTAEVIGRLRDRFPLMKTPAKQDICYATENRQRAVGSAAEDADLVLVVGSPNSSNSNRLVEEARRLGTRAHLVDGPEDIDAAWLADVSTLVVTSGASVPELLVQRVVNWVLARHAATVEERAGVVEDVKFRLPVPVR